MLSLCINPYLVSDSLRPASRRIRLSQVVSDLDDILNLDLSRAARWWPVERKSLMLLVRISYRERLWIKTIWGYEWRERGTRTEPRRKRQKRWRLQNWCQKRAGKSGAPSKLLLFTLWVLKYNTCTGRPRWRKPPAPSTSPVSAFIIFELRFVLAPFVHGNPWSITCLLALSYSKDLSTSTAALDF